MQVIEESYGKDDEAAVQRVKEVYRQLELEPLFKGGGQSGFGLWASVPVCPVR